MYIKCILKNLCLSLSIHTQSSCLLHPRSNTICLKHPRTPYKLTKLYRKSAFWKMTSIFSPISCGLKTPGWSFGPSCGAISGAGTAFKIRPGFPWWYCGIAISAPRGYCKAISDAVTAVRLSSPRWYVVVRNVPVRESSTSAVLD